ncbi:PAS domain S-box-containing protein/diguanylate cyclase (GGDEF) domain-containing protein [Oceanospirillum multiglobuliferum]|uniref:Diguanylate cyclase n=1 Tax=Oceanospirillum multiglobuliferum TaxID=64969 RepID=A0A1T4LI13_9GAMM|nr:sensor domain-containing diguanylate cyclase [Oceanospirillum multiglobuliferum]OPX56656.1 hypothetical protein BTE48_01785 [Oceanospirillum multiglobuliferum]SJZ54248.1 PAS domain S-box-containing protein/diguanylate cyclase (GGDEF) domain-containing protein [Oceanospirillum multiglobuliferum]
MDTGHKLGFQIQEFDDQESRRLAILIGLRLFTVLFVILVAAFTYFLENDYQSRIQQLQSDEQGRLETISALIASDFSVLQSDIATLSHLKLLNDFINQPSQPTRMLLEQQFEDFVFYRQIYDQMRLIDLSGQEVVRINFNQGEPETVDRAVLQNKADRYYFQQTQALNMGQVYISPIDLNVEFNQIEEPYKPVMRVITPLFNHKGDRWGILVLNYRAERMLTHLSSDSETGAQIRLVDGEGHWLYEPAKNKSWALLAAQTDLNQQYAAIWRQMTAETDAQISLLSDGEFTAYHQLVIGTDVSPNFLLKAPIKWLLASTTSVPKRLKGGYDLGNLFYQWVFFSSLALIIGIAWLWAVRGFDRKRWERLSKLALTCVEQSQSAVIITDPNGRIVYTNPHFTTLTGYDFVDIKGQKPNFLRSGLTPEATYHELWRTLNNKESWQGQFVNKKRNGEVFWCQVLLTPITDREQHVTHYLCLEQDITQQKESEYQLQHLANHDALTGLANRNHLYNQFSAHLVNSADPEQNTSVLMIDIDHFKTFNDTYGHQAGDFVLQEVARLLSVQARQTDIVGRYGGEEFILVLPNTPLNRAIQVAERIRQSVCQQPFIYKEQTLQVTVSIGCSSAQHRVITEDDLIHQADMALYRAKHEGRDRVCAE